MIRIIFCDSREIPAFHGFPLRSEVVISAISTGQQARITIQVQPCLVELCFLIVEKGPTAQHPIHHQRFTIKVLANSRAVCLETNEMKSYLVEQGVWLAKEATPAHHH